MKYTVNTPEVIYRGPSLCTLLAIVFITLKLLGVSAVATWSWVIGCTITTETPEDSIIEESEEDVETALISGNGFSKEVTFYERN